MMVSVLKGKAQNACHSQQILSFCSTVNLHFSNIPQGLSNLAGSALALFCSQGGTLSFGFLHKLVSCRV